MSTATDDPQAPSPPATGSAEQRWRDDYAAQVAGPDRAVNRSGIVVKPLYGPLDPAEEGPPSEPGYPGQYPLTRGIHASMYRGRPWSQRLVVGLGLPEDYNRRMHALWRSGVTGLYLAPCNSHMRGFDADAVEPELLGTCGTVINTVDDMARCLDGLPFEQQSLSLGDTAPFTLSAMLLALAQCRGIPWSQLSGTTNQSDYLSHYAALHMFFRLSLPGARRLLLDHVEFMLAYAPKWNPVSVIGQHMQQAGASPAEAMGFTLSSAVQIAEDLLARGLDPDDFLPRFSFFFDVSISFFEEIAKFRAGRRMWARLARERLGARDPRAWRLRFHAQTSGADLTRQQPLNNISRVAVQAMAGLFGGLQSLHTDAYDEALTSPGAGPARIAINTQNVLREEAHLDQVIDPLGGSYYVESLTNEMEARIRQVMDTVDAAGGMYRAVESGLVQRMIGESALRFQNQVDSGEQTVVGVNAYQTEAEEETERAPAPLRLSPAAVERYLAQLATFRAERDQGPVARALDALAAALQDETANAYAAVVEAAVAGATHGEICARTRREVGFGEPLIVA